MRIIAIANQKGGVGKTTTAVNLAAALAAVDRKILLLDLDPQGNATSALGVESDGSRSLYGPLIGQGSVKDNILSSPVENLWLVPAGLDLAGAEIEVARMDDHLTRLRDALGFLATETGFDCAFLDCPPSLGILMTNALAAAHELLVPLQCEYFALEGLSKIVQVVEQIRQSEANPGLAIGGIVMTMYDGRTNLSQQVVGEVRSHFPEVIYETVIPRTIRLGEAPSFGKTILDYDPHGTGALAYRELAREFLDRQIRSGGMPRD